MVWNLIVFLLLVESLGTANEYAGRSITES